MPPELANGPVTVTHRLGSPVLAFVTDRGVTVALHHRAGDGTGATIRSEHHVTALNKAALAAFTTAKPHRRKQRIPPGPAALAENSRYQQLRAHLTTLKLLDAAAALPAMLDQARTENLTMQGLRGIGHRAAEADGIDKYRGSGTTAADPMPSRRWSRWRAEKEREWQLQAWGIRVVRYTWSVAASTPDALAERCAVLMRADPLPASRPVTTWPRLVGYQLRGMTPAISRWSAGGGAGAESSAVPRSA